MHEKLDLIFGLAVVGGATAAGWYYTLDYPAGEERGFVATVGVMLNRNKDIQLQMLLFSS